MLDNPVQKKERVMKQPLKFDEKLQGLFTG